MRNSVLTLPATFRRSEAKRRGRDTLAGFFLRAKSTIERTLALAFVAFFIAVLCYLGAIAY